MPVVFDYNKFVFFFFFFYLFNYSLPSISVVVDALLPSGEMYREL